MDLFGNVTQKEGFVKIKVSYKSAMLLFNGCDTDYIKNTCRASCCQSSTNKIGIVVSIHHTEQENLISETGCEIKAGLLQPKVGEKICPFKSKETYLCGLHFTDYKPFGCIASPFTLNAKDTLIVRNRYKMLKCYNDGNKIPAYKAFSASLVKIFGTDEAEKIKHHFDSNATDIEAWMPVLNYHMLKDNDKTKKQNDN